MGFLWSWARQVSRSNRKIHDEYILPVMTYGCDTWTLNNSMTKTFAVAQRKMERIMLGITLHDRKRNTWIRQETGLSDIFNVIRMTKHRWTGHIAQLSDNRWTIRATEWTQRDWTRKQGRPKTRWRYHLTRQLGPAWSRLAKDRYLWDQSREGFLGRDSSPRSEFSPDDDDDDDDILQMKERQTFQENCDAFHVFLLFFRMRTEVCPSVNLATGLLPYYFM